MSRVQSVAVIGGGPAGLRAAEVAAQAGREVMLFDAQRSVGRKFLVAGKSGLNLTNDAEFDDFVGRYSGGDLPMETWRECLAEFDNAALRAWALELGIETFASSSGKVFPTMMKAAPLLRRWVERLRRFGVRFVMNHRWSGLTPGAPLHVHFHLHEESPHGITVEAAAVVLAMGGGSWPRTGSDGGWTHPLSALGVRVQPLQSANCGWECAWTPSTEARVQGQPLHNLHVRAGDTLEVGELMLTRYGMEGTLMYQLGRALRGMAEPAVVVDFKPTFTVEQLVRKMESVRRNFLPAARERWKLPEAAGAIIEQFYGSFDSAEALARVVKACRIPVTQPRPLAEAISSAGGVAWSELDANLMLRRYPGLFCAGEMIDWEAPTGGFLLQGCLATGTRAGRAAAAFAAGEAG